MLADIKVQLQIWKWIECFPWYNPVQNIQRGNLHQLYCCKLARVRRRLLSWLQPSFSDCIGKAIFHLKHSGSLMLNIHCVVWEKLSLTNTISFPSANSRIVKTEIVETTEMLELIDQEIFLGFIHDIYWGGSSSYRMMLKSKLFIRRRQNIMTFGTVCSNLWLKRTKNSVTNVLCTLRFRKV